MHLINFHRNVSAHIYVQIVFRTSSNSKMLSLAELLQSFVLVMASTFPKAWLTSQKAKGKNLLVRGATSMSNNYYAVQIFFHRLCTGQLYDRCLLPTLDPTLL